MSTTVTPVTTPHPSRVRRWARRLLIGLALLLVVLVGLYWGALYFVQDTLLYPAAVFKKKAVPQQPTLPNAVVLTVSLPEGGSVPAWFYPAPQASAQRPAPVAILFHGNGEILGRQDGRVRLCHEVGWSALLPEYRGYGLAAGKPSQENIRQDMLRFYDLLVQRPEVDRTCIVFHGWSLGGGVATDLAAQRKPVALILESTFTSATAMAGEYYAPALLVRNPYRTDRVAPTLGVPVLMFHGAGDCTIPVTHGRRLHQLIPGSRYIEFECDHDNFPGSEANAELYYQSVRQFLTRILQRDPNPLR